VCGLSAEDECFGSQGLKGQLVDHAPTLVDARITHANAPLRHQALCEIPLFVVPIRDHEFPQLQIFDHVIGHRQFSHANRDAIDHLIRRTDFDPGERFGTVDQSRRAIAGFLSIRFAQDFAHFLHRRNTRRDIFESRRTQL
jgi:hypothetical protein